MGVDAGELLFDFYFGKNSVADCVCAALKFAVIASPIWVSKLDYVYIFVFIFIGENSK